MKRFFKRIAAFVTITATVASMGTVFAQTEMDNMRFAGYDLSNPNSPNKIYNEVINGKYTNKQVFVPVTSEWYAEGYESVYPYAGYSRMYIEGNRQDITAYNNLFPQWETRKQDYMWEIKAPYVIWERQQTKYMNETWKWDFGNEAFSIPDEILKTKTNRTAHVLDISMKPYGFGIYNTCGNFLSDDEMRMYSDFSVKAPKLWTDAVANVLTTENLSKRDANGRYEMTDAEIASVIPVVYSKYITAQFDTTGSKGRTTKNVASEYLKHMNDGWEWDFDSFGIRYDASISWTAPAYEMAEPYNYYQYLVINGVVMDGSCGKDRILRYTGGKASPSVTWKFAFFQNSIDESGNIDNSVYEVVERKYIDGVPAVDEYNQPIYRVPTGEYGNTYFKLNGNFIEKWITDDSGNKIKVATYENWGGSLGGLISGYISGTIYCGSGLVAPEQYKDLP